MKLALCMALLASTLCAAAVQKKYFDESSSEAARVRALADALREPTLRRELPKDALVLLRDPSWRLRAQALKILSEDRTLQEKELRPFILEKLTDSAWVVRAHAIDTVQARGLSTLSLDLVSVLTDPAGYDEKGTPLFVVRRALETLRDFQKRFPGNADVKNAQLGLSARLQKIPRAGAGDSAFKRDLLLFSR